MKFATTLTFTGRRVVRLAFALMITTLFTIVPAFAQNFTSDARRIGMGAIGGSASDASKLVGDSREYRSIGLPIGLFQVFKNTKIFNPGDDEFNPIRAMELAASPLHFTFNRNEGGPGDELVTDLIKSEFSQNLADYKGFKPDPQIDAAGLISPNWGMTFKVKKSGDGYQGFYVGAGPYVSVGTSLSIDQDLIDYLGNPSAPTPANTSFQIGDVTGIQGAMAITGGYRARLPVSIAHLGEGSSGRNGVFVALNFNYLHGLHYENADLDVTIETDNTGQVTVSSPSSRPIIVDRTWSEQGKGFSVDVSTQIVTDRWNAGFAVDGIGNRIDWEDLDAERWELTTLTSNGTVDFVKTALAAPIGPVRVKLPVRYSTNAGIRIFGLSTGAEYRHGLQKSEFHAGAEYSLVLLEFRGGLRYSRPKWNPTAGVGLNLGKRIGIDLAGFGTNTNVERDRKVAMALSLRINKASQ